MKTLIALVLVIGLAAVVAQSITEHTKIIGLPPAAARKLVEKAVTLKSGDSYQTVTNALGKPDLDQAFGGRSDRPGPAQRCLHYNLFRPEGAPLGREPARYVEVYLDFKTERVDSIFIKASLQ